jgi:trk system potassium uptake protein TrkA
MKPRSKRIAIAGAGNVGTHVAQDLKAKGNDIVLIDQNKELVESLRPELDVNWVPGDACELITLEQAVLSACDVMVAATGDDEDNLVISLLAKQEFAVPRVISRVNHPDNLWLFTETWGVDVAMSMPHLLASHVLEQGKVGLFEVTLADGSPAAGKTCNDLRLPPDCALVAVVREGHVFPPSGETPLSTDDEVLALASPEAEADLRRALIGEA